MAETAAAVGAFHAKWVIGNLMPGAPLLHVDAVVVTPAHSVGGVAELTQAINPPLDVHFQISGPYIDVNDRNTTHFVLLSTPPSPLVGAPYLLLAMALDADWKTGTASYRYVCGSVFGHQDNVPVKIEQTVAAAV